MKSIFTFAEECAFNPSEVWDFASDWVPVVEADQPLYAVLESYQVMREHDIPESHTEAFMDYIPWWNWDVATAGKTFKGSYYGQWESLEEYARQTLDDQGFMPIKTERTGVEAWLSYRDVLAFCKENRLQEPLMDMSQWEQQHRISRNGHVFQWEEKTG